MRLARITAIMVTILVVLTAIAHNQSPLIVVDVTVNWVEYSNPSGGDDSAQAVCGLSSVIMVFGLDSSPGDYQFRVEVRDSLTGALKSTWTRNPGGGNDTLVDCTTGDGVVYAVGATITVPPKAYVLKVDPSLSNIEVKDLGWLGLSTTIEFSSGYIYVGGGDLRLLNLVFRIDKLDGSLSRISSYKSQGLSGHHMVIADMVFNKITGSIWAVGVARNDTGDRWWIEVVNPDSMTLVKSIDPRIPGGAISAISDDDGYVYVVGDRGYIVKFNKDGNVVARIELEDSTLMKIAMVGDLILVAGHERYNGYYRHTVYLLDKSLNLVYKRYISEGVNADSYLTPGRMWVNGSRVYIAGIDKLPGDYRWVVYSLEVRGLTQTVTLTVTSTTTLTLTQPTTTTVTTTLTLTQPITTTTTQTTTTTVTETRTESVTSTTTVTTTTTIPVTTTTAITLTQPTTTTVTTTYATTVTDVRRETVTLVTTRTQVFTETYREVITTTRILERTLLTTITHFSTTTMLAEREVTRVHTTTLTLERGVIPASLLAIIAIALLVAITAIMLLRRR